jgi:hypothetical protein
MTGEISLVYVMKCVLTTGEAFNSRCSSFIVAGKKLKCLWRFLSLSSSVNSMRSGHCPSFSRSPTVLSCDPAFTKQLTFALDSTMFSTILHETLHITKYKKRRKIFTKFQFLLKRQSVFAGFLQFVRLDYKHAVT